MCSSENLLHILRTPFSKNISGRLLLNLLLYSTSNNLLVITKIFEKLFLVHVRTFLPNLNLNFLITKVDIVDAFSVMSNTRLRPSIFSKRLLNITLSLDFGKRYQLKMCEMRKNGNLVTVLHCVYSAHAYSTSL